MGCRSKIRVFGAAEIQAGGLTSHCWQISITLKFRLRSKHFTSCRSDDECNRDLRAFIVSPESSDNRAETIGHRAGTSAS